MPMYDVVCASCGSEEIDRFAWSVEKIGPCKSCGGAVDRVINTPSHAHGDEIDYVDENLGPVPIRIRSKEERRRLMAERGLVEFVRHAPVPGSDRSAHTSNWGGMDRQTLMNAEAILARIHGGDESVLDGVSVVDAGSGRALKLEIGNTFSGVVMVKEDGHGQRNGADFAAGISEEEGRGDQSV